VAEPNVFACEAAVAAFEKGGEWLDELREYLAENKRIACDFIRDEIQGLNVVVSHATYLIWIDIRSWGMDSKRAQKLLREKTGLFLSDGSIYGGNGRNFLRMNLACPRNVLMDGLKRLKTQDCSIRSVIDATKL
jgi:cystathionine beta-lyase